MTINLLAEALADYNKALRLGKREGKSLPVLDDILKEKKITAAREIPLGLVQIPSEQLVGTKTAGRSAAFSKIRPQGSGSLFKPCILPYSTH